MLKPGKKIVSMVMTEGMDKRVKAYAECRGVSRSRAMAYLIEEGLKASPLGRRPAPGEARHDR